MFAVRERFFPGDEPEAESIDGRRVRKLSPKTRHSRVQAELSALLLAWGRNRGAVGSEWRFHVSGRRSRKNSYVPDLAFVSFERLRPLQGADAEEPPFAPDVAIEIFSPGDREAMLARKIARYLAAGSVLVLDVRPAGRSIVAHGRGERTYGDGDTFQHEAVPGFTFDVTALFDAAERVGC